MENTNRVLGYKCSVMAGLFDISSHMARQSNSLPQSLV